MSIKKLAFECSGALQKEMDFFVKGQDETRKIYQAITNLSGLMNFVESRTEYRDIISLAKSPSPLRILDMGVAYGATSAYLALHGHRVTALEPSMKLCQDMVNQFQPFNLNIRVINGISEVADQIDEHYDRVVFYSSLHHCDDPIRALKNANKLLDRGGAIFVYEPVLKFYCSKKWFYKTLETKPEKLGHYGGNEHIYRVSEYVQFMKEAGFGEINSSPSQIYSLAPKKAVWDSSFRYFIKRMYYGFMKIIIKREKMFSPLRKILLRLSLITPVFTAVKKNS